MPQSVLLTPSLTRRARSANRTQVADLVPSRAPTSAQKIVVIIEPLDLNVAGNMMVNELNGVPCRGRVIISVRYPATPDVSSGTTAEGTSGGSIAAGVAALDLILHTAPASMSTDVLVFGHSQGAQVASAWLRLHANDVNRPNPAYVRFLLTGNPERKYGGLPRFSAKTPNNTSYTVQDLKIQYDGWADWPTQLPRPNWQSLQNAAQGMYLTHNVDYLKHNPSDATMFYTENTTVYAMIPNNLPMFDANRKAGQNALADQLQAQYQPAIESQYVRPEKPLNPPPLSQPASPRPGQAARAPGWRRAGTRIIHR